MIKDTITTIKMTSIFIFKNILILLILIIFMYISVSALLSQFIFLAFLGITLFFLRDKEFFIDKREKNDDKCKNYKKYFLYGLSLGVVAFVLNWILFII